MTNDAAAPLEGLLDRLRARADQIAAEMEAAYVAQIPEYQTLPAAVLGDVRRVSRENLEVWFRAVGERRPVLAEELAGFTASARERARQGISLESLLHAYRIGGTVGWSAVLRELGGASREELAAGLELAGLLLRYVDQVSTAVAQGYLDEREELITAEERHHRQVAELLLARGPTSAEAEERAVVGKLRLAEHYWVVIVVVSAQQQVRAVARRLRSWPAPRSVIVVPGEREILVLWPAHPEGELRTVREACRTLAAEGFDTMMAVAGPADRRLREAQREARAVASLSADLAGVVRLEDVALRALIHQTGGRIMEVVGQRVLPLLEYEDAHPGELSATLEAFIDCGASTREAARRLYIHRNTVSYRLNRIEKLTGLDPHNPRHLFLLYAGLRLAPGRDARER